ncbi:MAG: pyridoxal phosphate-dependent aminotransferase [Parvibaculaceae bacterium]
MTVFDPVLGLGRHASGVEESAIARMAQKARDLRGQGHEVVSLTLGEPDFDTPAHIRKAAHDAIEGGFTHYAPVAGFPDLKAAIAKKLTRENGLDYGASGIVLANGAKQAIANAAFALLDPGDEVILLAPYWVSYEATVRLVGATPVMLHAGADESFKVPAARIAAALSPRTKLLILNSPNNPTGAVHTRDELAAIAKVIAAHERAFVLSDEIYEYLTFEGDPCSFGSLPGMRDRTITINGFSKGFAMTGWRLGYAAAAAPVAEAMGKMQSTISAGANAFVQRAALAAIEGGRAEVEEMRDVYRRRRDMAVSALSAMPGVRISSPPGTFYIFPNVSSLLGRTAGNHTIETAGELCDWLLAEHHVATVPGSAFGDADCIRLSVAASDAEIAKGLERIGNAFSRLA